MATEKDDTFGNEEAMDATHWEFDIDQETPEVSIADVVAGLKERETTSLPPLYRSVDDLINRLFSEPPPAGAQARIEFTYAGYRILLHQDGHATFMPLE